MYRSTLCAYIFIISVWQRMFCTHVICEQSATCAELLIIVFILGGCPFHGRVERDEIPTRESPPKQSGTR